MDLTKKFRVTRKTSKKGMIIFIIGVIVFTCISFFVATYIDNKNRDSLLKNEGFTTALVTKIELTGHPVVSCIVWQIVIKGNTYTFHEDCSDKDISYDSLIGKVFPAIYDTTSKHHYQISSSDHILIFPNDFKQFNIPFPDSLKWVLKFNKKYKIVN